jgi:2,4-dienoyl-CoA reductase-like NADH-dependent reductase (Old Yellow Enzyme family)
MTRKLFEPYALKAISLKNRIVMAPMTRCRAGEGDVPTGLMAEYYGQRATAGLIITEGIPVYPKARGYLWTPGIYTVEQIEGWQKVAHAVHNAGGVIFAQIWHTGRVSHKTLQPDGGAPEGPTDERSEEAICFAHDQNGNPDYVPVSRPQFLDSKGINRVREAFAQAAINALKAGIDGVEIHAANGYLFDQFLSSVVNTRLDSYGGTVENRCRLLLQVVDDVADAIGMDRIGVRISPNGRFNAMPEDPEMEKTFLHLAAELDKRDICYLHINDQATFGMPAIPEALLPKIRNAFHGTIILCGGYDALRADHAISEGTADLVAFGVAYLANPDLPARLKNNWPLNEADKSSFYGGGEKGYTDYPFYQP